MMLVLLPPSETKRDGGFDGNVLSLGQLGFPSLAPARRSVLAATRRLARNGSTMSAALRLGPSQQFEVVRNRQLGSSPTMPALDRYTGVLYDALDVASLDASEREFAEQHVVIHSALFGLLRGSDPIPAYRLSHDSRLPALPLKKAWREPISAELSRASGLILDLRSEAYVELGPAPGALFLRVVARAADGQRRALNHFNKKGKGEFVRALVKAQLDHPDEQSLLAWASSAGIALTRGTPGELQLEVTEIVASRT
jgi:cytoplasmic iron level regulating protein YaaA (DUF328/UPF0246 family)